MSIIDGGNSPRLAPAAGAPEGKPEETTVLLAFFPNRGESKA
jgi:hypothetical protein